MLRKGRGGLCKAPAKEEIRHRKAKRRERSYKVEEGKTFYELHVLWVNDELWDRARGLGSETWKGCE